LRGGGSLWRCELRDCCATVATTVVVEAWRWLWQGCHVSSSQARDAKSSLDFVSPSQDLDAHIPRLRWRTRRTAMYRRSLAVAARASRVPTGARLAARAVNTSVPSDAPLPLRTDSARDEPPLSAATVAAIAREDRFSAHNYHSIPCVIEKAKGVYVWDVDGKRYLDALAGYSAVNQGHGHPAILKALHESSAQLGLVSRAFHSARFGEYAEQITTLLGYDKVCARAARAAAAWLGASARAGARATSPRCPPSSALLHAQR
jgi:hypothetical protein